MYEQLKNVTLPNWPIFDTNCQLWAKSRFRTCCTFNNEKWNLGKEREKKNLLKNRIGKEEEEEETTEEWKERKRTKLLRFGMRRGRNY